ncbi:hypothetical protein V8F20_012748 [Naviculisporaceae sp. PSN 640]
MLTIDSLFSSNLLDQLRTIIHMSPSRDTPNSSPTGRDPELQNDEPTVPSKSAKEIVKMTTQHKNGSTPAPGKKTKRIPRRITSPEEGSLYDIMHEHAGKSLYTLPICWTDLHAQVLGARFQEHPTISTPVPDYIAGQWLEPSFLARNITHELHVLVRNYELTNKTRAIKYIMSTLFPDTLSNREKDVELDMYFGNRLFTKAVKVHCLWKSPVCGEGSFDSTTTMPATSFGDRSPTPGPLSDVSPDKPILAYLCRGELARSRGFLYRVAKNPVDGTNYAVSSLQKLRSKMLIPKKTDHDSYLVATIIAMAQSHFYQDKSEPRFYKPDRSSKWGGSRPLQLVPQGFRDVTVRIITHEEKNESSPTFIVYTATVTAAFLERFLHPHKAPLPKEEMERGAAGLKIDYTTVPFWPILGLKERLAKALGRDIAGEPMYGDPEHIGLWEPLLEEPVLPLPAAIHTSPPRPIPAAAASVRNTLKRRRDAEREQLRPTLSEMLNSSFEEETTPNSSAEDLDKPVLSPDAKRRRTAASTRSRGAAGGAGTPSPLEVC